MANKFHVNTVLLSGQALTANSTDLFLNNNRIANAGSTGQFITSAQTGQFAPSGMTGQFVTTAQTGHIHSQYALVSDTGQFISTAQTGQFAPSGLTGQFITTAQTGHIHSQYITAQQTGLVPELLLVVTGQVLSGNIPVTGISGVSIYTSGAQLVFSTYSITSATGQFIDTSETGIFVARGETGNAFYPRFGNPAGYVTNAVGGGGVTGINVTGSIPITGLVTFTGGSGILTSISGQNVIISILPSSLTTISGIGGTQVISSGTFLLISGGSSIGDTGQFITTAQTGQFAPASQMVTQTMTGMVPELLVVVTGQVLSGNLPLTGISGVNIYTSGNQVVFSTYAITSATGQFITSAQTGQFAPSGMTGQFVTTNKTGGFVSISQTGQFVDSSKTGQFITTAQTGQYAPAGLTGQFVTTAMTGHPLLLLNITGQVLSGNLPFTGISGLGIYMSGGILVFSGGGGGGGGTQGPTGPAGGLNTINVSGGLISGNIIITGIGNMIVYLSGQSIIVSESGDGGSFVDLTTNQIIDGNKIFIQDVRISGISADLDISNSGITQAIHASGYVDNYYEINVYNMGSGGNSSSDIVVSSTVSDTNDYVDLGVNSLSYTGAFVGMSGDAYLYSAARGDFYIGNTTSGRNLVLFSSMRGSDITGVASGDLIIDNSGRVGVGKIPTCNFDVSGSGVFSDSIIVGTSVVVSAQVVEPNRNRGVQDVELFCKSLANRALLHSNDLLSNPYALGPALWNKQISYIMPGAGASQTSGGCGAVSLGTITNVADMQYGYQANFATAATTNAAAGTSISVSSLFRGPNTLASGTRNGFFLTCRFTFPDATGTWMTGGSTGFQSGVRFFFGVTDQTLATVINSTVPTGHRLGFSFIRSTGGAQGAQADRNDNNFQFVSCNNNTQTLQNTNLPWNSGEFRAYLFMPPAPNTDSIYWRIDDNTRNTFSTGSQTVTLPTIGTPLRGAVGMSTVSGVKNLRVYALYSEV